MQIHHITLTRTQLDRIPTDERSLIILLAHASNELNTLVKIFRFCSASPSGSRLETLAVNSQAMVMGRALTGKIFEFWELLRKAFYGTGVSRKYEPAMDSSAAQALSNLKRYFGADNLIKTVRNRHAFHYSGEQIAVGYEKLHPEERLDIYLTEDNANSLYAFADVIANTGLLNDIDPDNHARAMKLLVEESGRTIGWANEAMAGIMSHAIELYLAPGDAQLEAEMIELKGASDWNAMTIPFFFENPGRPSK